MRIGSQVTSRMAGMSALWHDADYLPDKHIHIPTVERGIDDMPLPSEQHQLPPGAKDPFAKLDQVYDVAAQQMERGLEGQAFLHGRPAPAERHERGPLQSAELHAEVTRTYAQAADPYAPQASLGMQEHRATQQQLEARAQAGQAPPRVSNATQASDARQQSERAQKALEVAEGLGVSVAAMAVSQALDPSGALGAQAASALKAVSVAKTAVGMATAMQEESKARGIGQGRVGRKGAEEGEDTLFDAQAGVHELG